LHVEELETELKGTRERSHALEMQLLSRRNEELSIDDLQDLATTNHEREHLSGTNHIGDDTSRKRTGKSSNVTDDSGDGLRQTLHDSSNHVSSTDNQRAEHYQNENKTTNHIRDTNSRHRFIGTSVIQGESRGTTERTNECTRKKRDQISNENHINSLVAKNSSSTSEKNNNRVNSITCSGKYEINAEASFIESPDEVLHTDKETACISDCQMNFVPRRSSV
jgi:hypothetical protein